MHDLGFVKPYITHFRRAIELNLEDHSLTQRFNLFSFLLLNQFIIDTTEPIWVVLAKKGVLKGWVNLGTCILKRVS